MSGSTMVEPSEKRELFHFSGKYVARAFEKQPDGEYLLIIGRKTKGTEADIGITIRPDSAHIISNGLAAHFGDVATFNLSKALAGLLGMFEYFPEGEDKAVDFARNTLARFGTELQKTENRNDSKYPEIIPLE
jgi:hypothetical protein